MSDLPNVAVVVVAAGRGRRMASGIPKQYLDLCGEPILRHTLRGMLALPSVARVVTVIHADDTTDYRRATEGLDDVRLAEPVPGGADRAASVRHGLEALAARRPDIVLIHDAARPFCPPETVQAVIDACRDTEGAFAAVPVVDALWRVGDGMADVPVARDGLWRAQTPQGFRFEAILEAHTSTARADALDDVQIARAAGLTVQVVPGPEENFKITTPDDLHRAERIAGQRARARKA